MPASINRAIWASVAMALFNLGSIQLLAQTAAPEKHEAVGYTDTPQLPGQPWRVHDIDRPHPAVVVPATTPGGPPSDAIILFDGKDLSTHWVQSTPNGPVAPKWRVGDGYAEVVPDTGDIQTKEKFGDIQLHVEWSSPNPPVSNSQGRGNSGILLPGRYEIQVLDAWNNTTYADGQAGAMYGQFPPLVNPARKPGEWNTYDIIFEAARFDSDKLVKPATVTVIFNGVLVQNHHEFMGPTIHRKLAHYEPMPAEATLALQNHRNPVRYRNVWVRRLTTNGDSK